MQKPVFFVPILILLLLCANAAHSQEFLTEVRTADSDMVLPTIETAALVADGENLLQRQHHLYVKTNSVGWALGVTNLAAEVDIAPHWSFSLPVYWSSWNYLKQTLKIRTLAVQPEVRYWLAESNEGWFAGAHLGMASYNFATGGDYRIQDHDGHSPAFGGGVVAGYRMPLFRNTQWLIDFSLGAGVYRLHYDKFHNKENGLLVETKQKTWFGIDQVAVSIAYTFDWGKKGGTR